MSKKKRVYQVAKELGISNEEIKEKLHEIGIDIKNASQSIEEEVIEELYNHIETEKEIKEAEKEEIKEEKLKEEKKEPPKEKPQFKEKKKRDKQFYTKTKVSDNKIEVFDGITIRELAERMGLLAKDVLQKLITKGMLLTVNQPISAEDAENIIKMFGFEPVTTTFEEKVAEELIESQDEGELVERAPVVTVMGHVDHGKTTLLDAIRNTNVAEKEAGRITQHIGAYKITWKDKDIVFIDTPGHEAFTQMRARGAKVTDIVILVVAADDGVNTQTIEAINHARAAEVPIIVAINKIDKPEANPMRVKQQLAQHGLLVEEYGGDVVSVEISAKKKIGIEDLLEMILLVAELQELKGNPKIPAKGIILEAKLDPKRGPVATVLIQEGVLRVGNPFISGVTYGKVRAMFNEWGKKLNEARMVTPVEVIGFNEPPIAGDPFQVVPSVEKAQQIASLRKEKKKEEDKRRVDKAMALERLHKKLMSKELKELNIILKADVQGTLEALEDSLRKIKHEQLEIKIIHKATGAINESDVLLAEASGGIIIGYHVRPSRKARELAKSKGVEIRYYDVIYHLIEELKQAIEGILEPIEKEVYLGTAEVKKTFKIPKVGTVAGCYVSDGKIEKNAKVRVLRNGVVIFTGDIASLKHYSKDVDSIKNGQECGIKIENFNDVKAGDLIEAFKIEKIKQKIK